MGMYVALSSETSVPTYRVIGFLTQMATAQYEIKIFEVRGAFIFYKLPLLCTIYVSNLIYLMTSTTRLELLK
jgi:hypothetical protein